MRIVPRLKSTKEQFLISKVENAHFTSPSTTFAGCYSFQKINNLNICFVFDARGIKGQN